VPETGSSLLILNSIMFISYFDSTSGDRMPALLFTTFAVGTYRLIQRCIYEYVDHLKNCISIGTYLPAD